MRSFFIRHGQTEHTEKHLLAGVTDSRLTEYGVFQAEQLGAWLVQQKLRFTHIYASDLQRAYNTAQAIADVQNKTYSNEELRVIQRADLRERDFGSMELAEWEDPRWQNCLYHGEPEPPHKDFVLMESTDAMNKRADRFLDEIRLHLSEEDINIAVVGHGMFLGRLWRAVESRFGPVSGNVDAGVNIGTWPSGLWSSTGYLEFEIQLLAPPNGPPASINRDELETSCTSLATKTTVVIKKINCTDHLKTLQKTSSAR